MALRESVLLVNGSHIRSWWISHHIWSAAGSLLMLALPISSPSECTPAADREAEPPEAEAHHAATKASHWSAWFAGVLLCPSFYQLCPCRHWSCEHPRGSCAPGSLG